MGIDHLIETGKHSPDVDVHDGFVDDVMLAVLTRRCFGRSLEASLNFLVDHLSAGNLKVVRADNPKLSV